VSSHWWHRNIVEPGKLPLLLILSSFVVIFVVTRTITRLIRAGRGPLHDNVSSSGLHVHHAVPGILLLIGGAFVAVGTTDPVWRSVAAVVIGVGTSLVLDEFALILRLEDVYWTAEGRVSVEMVCLAIACLGLPLVGLAPFGVDEVDAGELSWRAGAVAITVSTLAVIVVCVLKGKFKLALFGIFVPVLAWIGALRLARPSSTWARRRYAPHRQARAEHRAKTFDARWLPVLDRASDLIAGRPSKPSPDDVA
jgi:hypothetical protein